MSNRLVQLIIRNNFCKALTSSEMLLLIVHADLSNDDGTLIKEFHSTSITLFCNRTGFSRKGVIGINKSLMAKGVLIQVREGKKGLTSLYRIDVEALKKLSPKSVDKPCGVTGDSNRRLPGDSNRRLPGDSHPGTHIEGNREGNLEDHNDYKKSSVHKNKLWVDNVDLALKLSLEYKVYDPLIISWIKEYGPEPIWFQIGRMKETMRIKKILNPGSYLAECLEVWAKQQGVAQ